MQCAENPKDAQPLYGPHLLSYLIENELHNARFLWRRIPKKVKETDPELNAIWALGQNVWNRKYSDIYRSAQGHNWSPGTVLFVQAFVERFRERTFRLIANAYANISTSDMAVLVGLSEPEAIKRTCHHHAHPLMIDRLVDRRVNPYRCSGGAARLDARRRRTFGGPQAHREGSRTRYLARAPSAAHRLRLLPRGELSLGQRV